MYLDKVQPLGMKAGLLSSVASTFEVTVVFKAFIPDTLHPHWPDAPWFNGPWLLQPPEPLPQTQYKGDNRAFFAPGTSRLESWARVVISSNQAIAVSTGHRIGPTHRRDVVKRHGSTVSLQEDIRTADDDGMKEKYTISPALPGTNFPGGLHIQFIGNAAMPFLPGPAIDYDVSFLFLPISSRSISVLLTGEHNRFPGYEAYIEIGKLVRHNCWSYDPAKNGEYGPGILNLGIESSSIAMVPLTINIPFIPNAVN